RQHAQKSLRRRLDKQHCPRQATHNARRDQRNHHALGNVEVLAIGPAARSNPNPKRQRVRGVGGDRANAGEEKRGKRDKAAAAGDGIERAAQPPGGKQKDGLRKSQASLFITNAPVRSTSAPDSSDPTAFLTT